MPYLHRSYIRLHLCLAIFHMLMWKIIYKSTSNFTTHFCIIKPIHKASIVYKILPLYINYLYTYRIRPHYSFHFTLFHNLNFIFSTIVLYHIFSFNSRKNLYICQNLLIECLSLLIHLL